MGNCAEHKSILAAAPQLLSVKRWASSSVPCSQVTVQKNGSGSAGARVLIAGVSLSLMRMYWVPWGKTEDKLSSPGPDQWNASRGLPWTENWNQVLILTCVFHGTVVHCLQALPLCCRQTAEKVWVCLLFLDSFASEANMDFRSGLTVVSQHDIDQVTFNSMLFFNFWKEKGEVWYVSKTVIFRMYTKARFEFWHGPLTAVDVGQLT